MTDRDKIIEIVLDADITGIKIRDVIGGMSTANTIADALIAAGIGDVKEAERRAEVAEKDLERHKRALYCACKASATVVTKELVKARVDCFLRKAEKDLAEEKKQ